MLRGLADRAEPLYEAKLLVTGEGTVGKSWALAALQKEDPNEAVGAQTTYGIDRGTLTLDHPTVAGTEITLNTWDFGGQKVYRVTHQFFFSEEAVYLLVWNPRQGAEQCQVREWLRRIELRTGGNAKVIMVASHCPAGKSAYSTDYGRGSLPEDLQAMIVDEIAIDSNRKADGSDGDKIPELRELIAKHASGLPRMGEQFPAKWKAAREAVEKLKKKNPYIKYARFTRICNGKGITDADQIFTLARVFMHELGRAVYYGERRSKGKAAAATNPVYQDAMLADIMILDAEWLSKAFVRVLDDEETKTAGGVLEHVRLDVIWRTHGRKDWSVYQPAEHYFLIRLMGAFDVSYVVKDTDGEKSLVAQLVPERRPPLPWLTPGIADDEQTLRMVCALENEAPGLMARFIVQTAPHHVEEAGRGLFWTDGVFMREPAFGDEALATVDGAERPVVTLTVRGKQAGWFLGELYRTLDTLLNFWPGLEKTYHVLCPKVRDDGKLFTGRFDFDFLVAEQMEHPDDNQICQACRSRWKPRDLLFGYGGVARQRDLQAAHERFLARQEAPCPRAFTLWPSDGAYFDPQAVKLTGKKLRLTLYSEHSGMEVVSKDFKVTGKWVKLFGPVARVTALALTGIALPLTGEIEKDFGESARFMSAVGGLPVAEGFDLDDEHAKGGRPEGVPNWVTGSDAEVLHDFLKQIKLAPKFGGMKFVKIRNKGWLWVSMEEAEAYAEVEPVLAYLPKK